MTRHLAAVPDPDPHPAAAVTTLRDIPARVRPYAEVIVVRETGVAHRPASFQTVVGTSARWDADLEQMVEVPVHGFGWYPRCEQPPGPDEPAPTVVQHSAGWAHHLGYPGCAVCWPTDDKE